MEDEFLIYLKEKVGEHLIASFEHADLLLWGARDGDGVVLLGLTLAIGVQDPANMKEISHLSKKVKDIMEIAFSLSKKSNSVFFTICYSISGSSLFRITNPKDPLNLMSSLVVDEKSTPAMIERLFMTNFGSTGTEKPVNKSTSDWFHRWTRANLPTQYVKANIDGLVLDQEAKPVILLETKRSFESSNTWRPYQADSRNYYLQNMISKKAALDFWAVYHVKGLPVDDSSDIALFIVTDVSLINQEWISYARSNVKARKVIELIQKRCGKMER